MTVLQEVIKQLADKRESQLKNEKTAGEKVSVLTHGHPAVWVVSMSQYATQQQVDYGARDVETAENTTMVTWCSTGKMWPVLTAGGRQ